MRETILGVVLVAAAATQAAADPCQVTIARAPEDVRAVVEQWVAAEPRCSVALEVRIVPTEGGLYLLARDDQGRVRERVVPDAQSAGVLIASWAADDAGATSPPVTAPVPAPVVAPAPVAGPALAAPGVVAPEIGVRVAQPAPARWLTLGGLVGSSSGGLRVEADLWRHGAWSIGGTGSYEGGVMNVYSPSITWGYIDTVDIKLLAYLARTGDMGHWHIRGAVGAGAVISQATATLQDASYTTTMETTDRKPFGVGEASLVVSRDLGRSWGLSFGPVATLLEQQFEMPAAQVSPVLVRRDLDVVLFAGVQHRL